jgi:hypothetical protein
MLLDLWSRIGHLHSISSMHSSPLGDAGGLETMENAAGHVATDSAATQAAPAAVALESRPVRLDTWPQKVLLYRQR